MAITGMIERGMLMSRSVSTDELVRFGRMCREVAAGVWSKTAPNARYAESVGRLLYGTGCQETRFAVRRQDGFGIKEIRGAWGLFQTEVGSVEDGLYQLAKDRVLLANVLGLLDSLSQTFLEDCLHDVRADVLCRGLFDPKHDVLACVFARLHYARITAAVPVGLWDQAEYWDKNYNRCPDHGFPGEYVVNFARLEHGWALGR